MDGRELEFGVSGKLWRNSLIMFDRQTKSLWSHITGECLDGALKGKQLTMVASLPRITWSEMRKRYPQAKVLSVRGKEDGRDHYAGYHGSADIGIHGDRLKDDRLPAKQMIIGVLVAGKAKAYPLSLFAKTSVIEDDVGGEPVIVFHDRNSLATAAYIAKRGGERLRFESQARAPEVRDIVTGSTWNLIAGRAVAGPLKGERLSPAPSVSGYWFFWCDFYPETEVFRAGASH